MGDFKWPFELFYLPLKTWEEREREKRKNVEKGKIVQNADFLPKGGLRLSMQFCSLQKNKKFKISANANWFFERPALNFL